MADSKDFGLDVTSPYHRGSSFVPGSDKTTPDIELKHIHQGQSVEIIPPPYDACQEDEERRDSVNISGVQDTTHRKLKPRHIQLIGIGGTIGTALYVQIGRGLLNGGPGSLFLAFTIWCSFILAVTM